MAKNQYILVLNLIITGIPSILKGGNYEVIRCCGSFKPYYNWNTFNTMFLNRTCKELESFKPYYNWNTFNTTKCITVFAILC